jgi:hypothetical protein
MWIKIFYKNIYKNELKILKFKIIFKKKPANQIKGELVSFCDENSRLSF